MSRYRKGVIFCKYIYGLKTNHKYKLMKKSPDLAYMGESKGVETLFCACLFVAMPDNEHRPHQGIGAKTPLEMRKKLLAK